MVPEFFRNSWDWVRLKRDIGRPVRGKARRLCPGSSPLTDHHDTWISRFLASSWSLCPDRTCLPTNILNWCPNCGLEFAKSLHPLLHLTTVRYLPLSLFFLFIFALSTTNTPFTPTNPPLNTQTCISFAAEHISVACQLVSRLTEDYPSLLEVQVVLPEIIGILKEPWLVRSHTTIPAYQSVVSLLVDLVLSQFHPTHHNILYAFIDDVISLVNDIVHAIEQQEAKSLLNGRRLPLTLVAFPRFYNFQFEIVCDTSKSALAKLDASHQSRNGALLLGALRLLSGLLPHASGLSPSIINSLWSTLTKALIYLTPYLVDEEPSPSKLYSLVSLLEIVKTLLYHSLLPSTSILHVFLSETIQTSLIATLIPNNGKRNDTIEEMARNLLLLSSLPNWSLSVFPVSFVPSIASKIDYCTNIRLVRALLHAFHSRLKRSFVPPLTLRSTLQSLPSLMHIAELHDLLRVFSKTLYEIHKQERARGLKAKPYTKHLDIISSPLPSTLRLESIEMTVKKTKLTETRDLGTYSRSQEEMQNAPSFLNGFVGRVNTLFSEATSLRQSKPISSPSSSTAAALTELEAKALKSSIVLLKIQIDNLDIKGGHSSQSSSSSSSIRQKRRSSGSASMISASTSSASPSSSSQQQSPLYARLNSHFHVKSQQHAEIEMLTQGVHVSLRKIGDFLVERLSAPKSAPLSLFEIGCEFLDTVIDLMALLPPIDTQLPSVTSGSMCAVCELPFSHVGASASISRPSMIPMPSESHASHANVQLSSSPQVCAFGERCLLLSSFLPSRHGDAYLFEAALNDSRPSIVQSAIRHFPMAVARFSETSLQSGDLVSNFIHAGFQLLKSHMPFPEKLDKDHNEKYTSIQAATHMLTKLACITSPNVFSSEDPSTGIEDLRIALSSIATPSSMQFSANKLTSPANTFSILCSGRCNKLISGHVCFWPTTASKLRLLSHLNLEWDMLSKILAEYTNEKVDAKVRLLLLQAHKSIFCHCIAPPLQHSSSPASSDLASTTAIHHTGSKHASSTSPSLRNQLIGIVSNRASNSSSSMDFDSNSATISAIQDNGSSKVVREIPPLFHLAINGETHDLRICAAEAIVCLIDSGAIDKGVSAVNNAILSEMGIYASSLNRSSSQSITSGALDSDGIGSEETLLNLVGKIGGNARGWYVLPPLLLLLNYLTDVRVAVKACAYSNIQRMSVDHGLEPKDLLQRYEPKIALQLLKSLRLKASALVDEVCLTVLDVDPIEYLESKFSVLVPKIARKRDGELLELLATKTKLTAAGILITSMSSVLVATICLPNPPFDIIQFIVERVKQKPSELFSKYHRTVLFGLILMLGNKTNKRSVMNAFPFLIKTLNMANDPSSSSQPQTATSVSGQTTTSSNSAHNSSTKGHDPQTSSKSKNPSERKSIGDAFLGPPTVSTPSSTHSHYNSNSELIADRFLQLSNMLVYEHILPTNASLQDRLNALNAYKRMVKLLGSHIDKFYVIIGSVLRLTMTEVPELRSATCRAWKAFLKLVPDHCLGPILGATTVYLLSYDAYELEIVPILEYLFITKENVLKRFFRDVPLLPDRPALARVHAKWKEARQQPISSSSAVSSKSNVTGTTSSSSSKSSSSGTSHSTSSSSDLRLQLQQLILLAKNDDCSIREMALKQLTTFLHLHRSEFARFIAVGDVQGVDSAVSELVELLVKGSREQVPLVRLKFAGALGELGAIDPSRLTEILPNFAVEVAPLDHTDLEFAVELIEKYLVKTYRTARLMKSQDRACFTIQEILKFFGCDASTPVKYAATNASKVQLQQYQQQQQQQQQQSVTSSNPQQSSSTTATSSSNPQNTSSSTTTAQNQRKSSTGSSGNNMTSSKLGTPSFNFGTGKRDLELWSLLSVDTQSLIHPFLASQFLLDPQKRWISSSQFPDGSTPVSAYQLGMPYGIWLELWLERLIIDSKSGLFQACEGILSNDFETSHFILPHVVLSILHNGSPSAHESILHEMLVVLGVRQLNASTVSNVDGGASNLASSSNASLADSINTMAAQRIFTLIDCLSQWVELKYKEFRKEHDAWSARLKDPEGYDPPPPKADPRIAPVEQLLSKIPQLAVAKTALVVNAYSRALMHFEKSARENGGADDLHPLGIPPLKLITDSAEITVLQQIYANLDDPDAMEGLTHMKASGKALTDLLDTYRAAGRWNETLIALDQLLRKRQTDSETICSLQLGRLECLAELGLFDQLLSLATTCMSDPVQTSNSKHLQKVRSYGAHAAWKLGDWRTIETLLSEHHITTHTNASFSVYSGNFDLGIGQVFLALKGKHKGHFDKVLQAIRADLITPLGAASLESYERAYPHIVRLQMLNELEDAWKMLYGSVSSDSSTEATLAAASSEFPVPYGKDATHPINVSITNQEALDKSMNGLVSNLEFPAPSYSAPHSSSSVAVASSAGLARSSTPTLPNLSTMSVSDRTLRERREILEQWRVRLSLTQFNYKVREAILSLRLAVFGMAEMQTEATETWLELAKLSRKTGKFTMAQYAMLRVRDGSELASALESAKLLWATNERAQALVEMEKICDASVRPGGSTSFAASTPSVSSTSSKSSESRVMSGEVARQRLVDGKQLRSTELSSTPTPAVLTSTSKQPSKSSLSRSNSTYGKMSRVPSEGEIYMRAKLLKSRWMLASQFSVHVIDQSFKEALPNDKLQLPKVHYYYGLFNDHLGTEYKRKLYSLPVKASTSSSTAHGSSKSSTTSSKRTSSTSKGGIATATTTTAPLPPMLTPQAQQYWISIRLAFSALACSLVSSTKYCYQILPRLVSMWFEITEALQDLFVRYPEPMQFNIAGTGQEACYVKIPNKEHLDSSDKTAKQIIEVYLNAMRMITMVLNLMPASVWLISFSLLISGSVQRNKDVEELIGKIIMRVLRDYPQQAIWHIFPLHYSTNEERRQKYNWIRRQTSLQSTKGEANPLFQFFDQAASFAHQISVLCAHRVPKEKGRDVTEMRLADMCQMEDRIPAELIMPSEQQLSALPLLDASRDPKNPFAYQPVYIRRVHPKVSILKSLAKPRKIILYGSDEKQYMFLCKPVDDLRKDARMMEFSAMVNRLLKKDLETRRRDLRIRTYAVLPLSDSSGILSWVPNTNGLRGIISDVYAMDGVDLTDRIREIRKVYEANHLKEEWQDQFVEKILPRFPLALSKWFLNNFSEPSQWLRAKSNFARTCGVMSVVGTILGLGDRHCENILIDSKNGDCLHVDLNCIFHKGRTFLIPECVPFRLTRNMVDAFGITGVEGAFRKACELTMQTMKQNKDALLSVLGTFVHDPLLEWSNDYTGGGGGQSSSVMSSTTTRHQLQQQRSAVAGGAGTTSTTTNPSSAASTSAAASESTIPPGYSHERHNKLAVEILNGIADRLDGLMRTPDNLDQLIVPLSVQGYVDAIISDATSISNLVKMYVGWSSFI